MFVKIISRAFLFVITGLIGIFILNSITSTYERNYVIELKEKLWPSELDAIYFKNNAVKSYKLIITSDNGYFKEFVIVNDTLRSFDGEDYTYYKTKESSLVKSVDGVYYKTELRINEYDLIDGLQIPLSGYKYQSKPIKTKRIGKILTHCYYMTRQIPNNSKIETCFSVVTGLPIQIKDSNLNSTFSFTYSDYNNYTIEDLSLPDRVETPDVFNIQFYEVK